MVQEILKPRQRFIKAVADQGITFEDLAGITGIPLIDLYRCAAGRLDLSRRGEELLANVLEQKSGDLFD